MSTATPTPPPATPATASDRAITAKGYAHADALVGTAWLAAHGQVDVVAPCRRGRNGVGAIHSRSPDRECDVEELARHESEWN